MKRMLLIACSFIALLMVSAFLYSKTQAIDVEVQNQIVPALRELKRLDAEWNADVLKSRVGINSNYDAITAPLQEVRELRERLIHGVQMVHGGALEAALYRMENAFVDKEEMVEQFKSQNAVLRNSLRYFPTAVKEFKTLLQANRARAKQARAFAALEVRIDRLLADILRFNVMPEADLGERVAAVIADIERKRGTYPDGVQEALGLLVRHAQIVLRQRVVEDAVLKRISATPTAQSIDALSSALDEEFHDLLQEKQQYRTYLFVYSGFLLLLLTYAAWRLMHSYQLIAQGNRRLHAANETLEQRVAQRTVELERQSARLAELATYDTLTGLINRRQLMMQLAQALQRAERRDRAVALMFIDLDGFKQINDTYGHATGDLALQEAATRIKRHVRKEDAIARFGGDEFVILLADAGTRDGAVRVAEAVLRELRELTEVDGRPVRLSASIGIGSSRGAGSVSSPEALLSLADHAMYQAKQHGKDCYRFSMPNAWDAEAA